MSETQNDRVLRSIRAWTRALNAHPGWRQWQRNRIGHTLHFDDIFSTHSRSSPIEFALPPDLETQHSIVMQYFELLQVIAALKDCECYFRRYPFRGLRVTRYNHFMNACEMYFSRFYEYRERLKKYLTSVKKLSERSTLQVGKLIALYDAEFDQEIRERHQIHHHRRFEDLALDRLLLLSLFAGKPDDPSWEQDLRAAYRKASSEWVKRVKRRAAHLEVYMEAVAEVTLIHCPFLSEKAQ